MFAHVNEGVLCILHFRMTTLITIRNNIFAADTLSFDSDVFIEAFAAINII